MKEEIDFSQFFHFDEELISRIRVDIEKTYTEPPDEKLIIGDNWWYNIVMERKMLVEDILSKHKSAENKFNDFVVNVDIKENEADFEIQLFIESHLRIINYKMITRMFN